MPCADDPRGSCLNSPGQLAGWLAGSAQPAIDKTACWFEPLDSVDRLEGRDVMPGGLWTGMAGEHLSAERQLVKPPRWFRSCAAAGRAGVTTLTSDRSRAGSGGPAEPWADAAPPPARTAGPMLAGRASTRGRASTCSARTAASIYTSCWQLQPATSMVFQSFSD